MKRLIILLVLMGCATAYTLDLNVTGSMSSPYPMLFFQCNSDCSNVYVNYTARNHTSQVFKAQDENTLFWELSGLPSADTEALPVRIEITPSENVLYQTFPLNYDTVDWLSSSTHSIEFTVPADQLSEGSLLEEAFRFPTVSELLDMLDI